MTWITDSRWFSEKFDLFKNISWNLGCKKPQNHGIIKGLPSIKFIPTFLASYWFMIRFSKKFVSRIQDFNIQIKAGDWSARDEMNNSNFGLRPDQPSG